MALFPPGICGVWLGLTDSSKEGDFRWCDAAYSRLTYHSRWTQGEPNNNGGNEHCGDLYFGGINDSNCHVKQKVVCQKNEPLY